MNERAEKNVVKEAASPRIQARWVCKRRRIPVCVEVCIAGACYKWVDGDEHSGGGVVVAVVEVGELGGGFVGLVEVGVWCGGVGGVCVSGLSVWGVKVLVGGAGGVIDGGLY